MAAHRIAALLLVGAGSVCFQPVMAAVEAPALPEVLARHAAARGSAAAWKAVTSLEIRGMQIAFSEESPFTIWRRRPNLYRMEQTMLRQPVIEVFDGAAAWWINGLMSSDWPLPAPASASGIIAREAQFDTPLLDGGAGGHTIRVDGREDFEGKDAIRLTVALKTGGEETWYLDAKSWLEIARISTTVDFGESKEKRSYFTDFRPEGALIVPHRIEIEYGSRNEILEVSSFKVNPAIDDAIFRMPPPEGMEALAPMTGEWSVTIESRPDPRAPWESMKGTASIARLLSGGLLQERMRYEEDGLPMEVLRSWSFDRFQKLYRLAQTDNFSFHTAVLEGTMADGRLTLDNIRSATSWKAGKETFHQRVTALELTAAGFRIELETSRDGGKTWFNDRRLTYQRP